MISNHDKPVRIVYDIDEVVASTRVESYFELQTIRSIGTIVLFQNRCFCCRKCDCSLGMNDAGRPTCEISVAREVAIDLHGECVNANKDHNSGGVIGAEDHIGDLRSVLCDDNFFEKAATNQIKSIV